MSRMYFMVLLNSSKLYKEKQKNIRQSMVTILTMVIYHLSSKCSIQFASVKNIYMHCCFCFCHRMTIKFNAITRKSNKICIDYVMNASSNRPIHMVHQRSQFIVHFTLGIAFVWRVLFCSESFL